MAESTTTTTSTTTVSDASPTPTESSTDRVLDAFLEIIKTATSPDVIEAQNILLRRMALQGDVTPSRLPAPRNITEIGGYLNLLQTLAQPELRSQMLAGILGVAGPNPPLGWLSSTPPLSLLSIPNDRPAGTSQPAIPLSFRVRSDFALALQSAIKDLHDRGCQLPLASAASAYALPPAGITALDPFPFLGRTIEIVPACALRDPTNDPIIFARLQGSGDPFQLMARVLNAGTIAVPPADFDAFKCDTTHCDQIAAHVGAVAIAPALGSAGFYQLPAPPSPTSLLSIQWAHFVNVSGLVVGQTRLGDELRLLYSASEILGSAFANQVNQTWNGTNFV